MSACLCAFWRKLRFHCQQMRRRWRTTWKRKKRALAVQFNSLGKLIRPTLAWAKKWLAHVLAGISIFHLVAFKILPAPPREFILRGCYSCFAHLSLRGQFCEKNRWEGFQFGSSCAIIGAMGAHADVINENRLSWCAAAAAAAERHSSAPLRICHSTLMRSSKYINKSPIIE